MQCTNQKTILFVCCTLTFGYDLREQKEFKSLHYHYFMEEKFLCKSADGNYFIIDSNGNKIFTDVKCKWDSMPYSCNTENKEYNKSIMPYECTFVSENGDRVTKYGYTKNDKIIIEHKYNAVSLFQNGIARVSINGLEGFINTQGISIVERKEWGERELLVFPNLDLVEPFNHIGGYYNLAICIKDNLLGVVDESGGILIPCEYDKIIYPPTSYSSLFGSEKEYYLELIKKNDKSFALIDKSYRGGYYIPYITPLGMYIKAKRTKNNFYILTTAENTKTIVDCFGEQYIEDDCSDIIAGDNDLVIIKRRGKCGLYRFFYEDAVYFENIIPEEYDDINGILEFPDAWIEKTSALKYKRKHEQYIAIEKDGYIGIADIKGNILLPCIIKASKDIRILPHTYGDGMVGYREKWNDSLHYAPCGFINDKGNIQIQAQYQTIINGFKDGEAEVLKGSNIISINKQNKIVEDLDVIYEPEEPCEEYTWEDMINDAFEGDPDNYWNID